MTMTGATTMTEGIESVMTRRASRTTAGPQPAAGAEETTMTTTEIEPGRPTRPPDNERRLSW